MQQGKTEKKYVACRKKAHKINFIFTFCYIWQIKHIFLKYNSSFLKIIGTGNRLNIISSFWKNMTIQKTSVVSPWLFKFLNSSSWLLQVLTDFPKRDLLFKVLLVLQAFLNHGYGSPLSIYQNSFAIYVPLWILLANR